MEMPKKPIPGVGGDGEDLIVRLLNLPHKILFHHELDGLANMVLHELGHDDFLGFDKACYFVDNPDFDCIKGIAGYHSCECKFHKPDLWSEPHAFMKDMEDAQFHRKLMSFNNKSLARKKEGCVDGEMIYSLGKTLGLQDPHGCYWKMKHGNNGILIFEGKSMPCVKRRNLLEHIVALLSFC
jgi:hypothetical protein